MEYFNYKIIGTSHVAKESVKQIEKEIKEYNPDIVCIELDKGRLHSLLNKTESKFNISMIKQIGLTGFLFGLIGHAAQKKIGEKLNIIPGKDMLTAYKVAKKHKKEIKLIDQDVQTTLRNVSKGFNGKEKLKLFQQVLEAFFFRKRAMRRTQKKIGNINIDLNKVPSEEVIEKMIESLKDDFPGLHKAIVKDRNEIMSKRVFDLLKKNPTKRILVIVGAGHKKEMTKIINKKLKNTEYFPKKIEYNYSFSIN